ncbi:MAG: hypothetical protein Q9184_000342 [Pyrenodesmia sp. 2 TL-2023]
MASADIEIPKQYQAAVYDQPGKISTKIETLDTPEPGPNEVLIKLYDWPPFSNPSEPSCINEFRILLIISHRTHSGVCHSDLGVMENSWAALPAPTQAGQVGGHEGVGVVEKMGPGTERAVVKVGQRVGIKWVSGTCGSCLPCLEGHDALCHTVKISGYYTPGTFQQYVASQADYVTPIPENLKSEDAALASRGMAMRVIGIDHGSKEKLVRDCGAEHFIDLTKHDDKSITKEVVKTANGLGVSAVIVCTASNKAYAQSIDMLRFGGTVVWRSLLKHTSVGIPERTPEPIANAFPAKLVFKGATIASVAVGTRRDAIEVLDFAARGGLHSSPLSLQGLLASRG